MTLLSGHADPAADSSRMHQHGLGFHSGPPMIKADPPMTMIRGVRLVPLGGRPAPPEPVDVRIVDGVVTEVGPSLAVGGAPDVHEARGRWAMPGLWDGHVHMRQWALDATRLDLRGTAGPDAVVRAVADHIAALPRERQSEVVSGFGHRSATWPRRPTVAELDAVAGEHAVVLISGDAHNGWLSSRALALLGVPARDGPLEENEWFEVFARLDTLPGADAAEEAGFRTVLARAAAAGVVGVVDVEFGRPFSDWPVRFARGLDALRVRAATYPDHLDEALGIGLATGQALPGCGGLMEMGPLKIISDGSLNTRTAYCDSPYADAAGPGEARGALNCPPELLVYLLARARSHAIEVAVHAIGDAAAANALDAFEATGARGSIEHAQLVRWADLPRMARLGVRAGVQPAHLLDDRDVTERCWPDRADRCFAFRAMLDAGVTLVLGSDAPVAPLDPWLALAAAVHRSDDDRAPWHPEQAIGAAEALAASTDRQGTISPGSRGDVVILDDDPLGGTGSTADVAAHLRRIRVAATFVGGRPTCLSL